MSILDRFKRKPKCNPVTPAQSPESTSNSSQQKTASDISSSSTSTELSKSSRQRSKTTTTQNLSKKLSVQEQISTLEKENSSLKLELQTLRSGMDPNPANPKKAVDELWAYTLNVNGTEGLLYIGTHPQLPMMPMVADCKEGADALRQLVDAFLKIQPDADIRLVRLTSRETMAVIAQNTNGVLQ